MPSKSFSLTIVIFSFIIIIFWPMLPAATQPNTAAPKQIACAQPTNDAELCAAQEANILASVVRIVFHGNFQKGQHTDFRGSFGHATVIDGRYLVTHNHFSIDIPALTSANNQGLIGFSLYNAQGQRIVRNAPVGSFQVAAQDSQTLVLDFGADYFVNLGMASAPFLADDEAAMIAGAEVAQVDWDAERAFVVWTTVARTVFDHDSPHLELDNFVMPGASGGGVFWNGRHIANNWANVTITNTVSGNFMRAYSIAALNSQKMMAITAATHPQL